MSSKIIAFVSNKGGTGKTTACVNVAACLKEKKVLVIDLDPIASTTSYLGVKPEDFGEYAMQAVARGEKEIEDVIFEVENIGIHLAPSHRGWIFDKIKKGFLAKELKKIDSYDFIMMDTPPGFDEMPKEAIAACDTPIAALNESIFTIENLPLLKEFAGKEGKIIKYAILSTVNRRSRISKEVTDSLSKEFERSFAVPFDRRVPQSQAFGKPLIYFKRSRALKCYMRVAEFLAGGI